jgi:hypothetical protein
LIVLGFLIKRDWLAVTGSAALYLPTFGYFAFSRGFMANLRIHRYSRHPQYLGYVILSCGLLINTLLRPYYGSRHIPPPSLPWFISTLIIIGLPCTKKTRCSEHTVKNMLNTMRKRRSSFQFQGNFISNQHSNQDNIQKRKPKKRQRNSSYITFLRHHYHFAVNLLPILRFAKVKRL